VYGIIYKATSPDGKVYIGQTTRTLAARKSDHKVRAKKKDLRTSFQLAILEHGGVNAFIWEQIDQSENREELDAKEKYWIDFYNSMDPEKGYNNQDGGIHYSPSVEHRRKLSESQKGEKGNMFGKHPSAETRRKMSKAHKDISPEVRQKRNEARSEALKGKKNHNFGRDFSPEHRQKLSESHIGIQRGENSPTAKLTEADVREIKTALANGGTCASLARNYGVNRTAISLIKHGKTWAWLKIENKLLDYSSTA